MIRKLKSGEYRLYSRKKNLKTGKRRNLGRFERARQPRLTNARCNSSSVDNSLLQLSCLLATDYHGMGGNSGSAEPSARASDAP
jgi:hypothetical protein